METQLTTHIMKYSSFDTADYAGHWSNSRHIFIVGIGHPRPHILRVLLSIWSVHELIEFQALNYTVLPYPFSMSHTHIAIYAAK